MARIAVRTLSPRNPGPDRDPPASAPSRGCYVYCVVRGSRPLNLGPIGIDSRWPVIYTIGCGDLAAVVSDVPDARIDPTRDRVIAHDRVNHAVMLDRALVPMSFGTVFRGREDVVHLLRAAQAALFNVLQKMEGRVEFGLKVVQRVQAPFDSLPSGTPSPAELEGRAERHLDDGLQRLREVSVASRLNPPLGHLMILNAAFLVNRDGEQRFVNRAKEIARRFPDLGFKYTGPWPPYNFVDIRLKLERVT